MLTATQLDSRTESARTRRARPVLSTKQRYHEYKLQRIEDYKNSLTRDIPGGATLSWHYTRSTSSGSQSYDGERNIRGPLPSGRAIDVGVGFSGQAVSIGVVTACEMRATFTE